MVWKYRILWHDYVTIWLTMIGSHIWGIYFWGQGSTSLRKAGSAARTHEAHQCTRSILDPIIRTCYFNSFANRQRRVPGFSTVASKYVEKTQDGAAEAQASLSQGSG